MIANLTDAEALEMAAELETAALKVDTIKGKVVKAKRS